MELDMFLRVIVGLLFLKHKVKGEDCDISCVPRDKYNYTWGEWTPCVGCSTGFRRRILTCRHKTFNTLVTCSRTEICIGKPCQGGDGTWDSWQAWSRFTSNIQQRRRHCVTAPETQCPGNVLDYKYLNKSVDGGWGGWNNWSSCTATCGNGAQTRTRLCDIPRPAYGGKSCGGQSRQSQKCNNSPCPVDGAWGVWSRWSVCSKSCGGGVQIKHRLCNSPPPSRGSQRCKGSNIDRRECNTHKCPVETSLPLTTTDTSSTSLSTLLTSLSTLSTDAGSTSTSSRRAKPYSSTSAIASSPSAKSVSLSSNWAMSTWEYSSSTTTSPLSTATRVSFVTASTGLSNIVKSYDNGDSLRTVALSVSLLSMLVLIVTVVFLIKSFIETSTKRAEVEEERSLDEAMEFDVVE